MNAKKKAPIWNKPHLYRSAETGNWRMTGMPGYIQGEVTGRWARASMWVFNKNGGRKGKRRA